MYIVYRLQEYDNKMCVDDLCPFSAIKEEEPLLCELWHQVNDLKNTTAPAALSGMNVLNFCH